MLWPWSCWWSVSVSIEEYRAAEYWSVFSLNVRITGAQWFTSCSLFNESLALCTHRCFGGGGCFFGRSVKDGVPRESLPGLSTPPRRDAAASLRRKRTHLWVQEEETKLSLRVWQWSRGRGQPTGHTVQVSHTHTHTHVIDNPSMNRETRKPSSLCK